MNFVYEPKVQADIAAFVNYVTPVDGVKEILAKRDPKLAKNQLIFPDEQFIADCVPVHGAARRRRGRAGGRGGLAGGHLRLTEDRAPAEIESRCVAPPMNSAGAWSPTGCSGRARSWLTLFFVVPMYFMGELALRSGTFTEGFTFSWEFSNYPDALEGRREQIGRTFFYSGVATVLALLIAYPLAYVIAFRAVRAGGLRCCSPSSRPSSPPI